MKRKPFLKTLLFYLFLFVLFLCFPSETVASYQYYENIQAFPSADFGKWRKTEIYIPKGAIMAVMAKGMIWDIRNPDRWQWQPYDVLRFKIGEGGRESPLDRGANRRAPLNGNMVVCEEEGFLLLGFGTWWKIKSPPTKRGEIHLRVIVWEKEARDRIEEDLMNLVRKAPQDEQIRGLIGSGALCFGQMGEYQKVQNLYKMMKENSEFDWDSVYPMVLNQLSDFEIQLGRYEKAKGYLRDSLNRIRGFGNPYLESLILTRLGIVASRLKQYEEAHQFFDQALTLSTSIQNPEAIGICLLSMGWNRLRMDQPAEAEVHFQRAIQVFQRRDRFLSQRRAYLGLGECYVRLNRIEEARTSFESALTMGMKVYDSNVQWQAHSWLGRIAEKEGKDLEAFKQYAKSIEVIETMRGQYLDPNIKALFMRDKLRVYERMIRLLYKMGRAPEALHYLERARARVMLDMLVEKAFVSKNKEENELLIQERALRRQIEEFSLRVEKGVFERTSDSEKEISEDESLERSLSKIGRLTAQHKAILERIERLNPELASLLSVNPLKANEIQGLLDDDTALLEYFIGAENQYVFLVTSQKISAFPLKADGKTIFEKIKTFRVRAVEGISLDRLLSRIYERPLIELYEILIQPITKEIFDKKHLVIVPHGVLHYLPFQALLTREGKYLIEFYTMSYLPSASVLKFARMKNRGNREDLFALGNPKTEFLPLPSAELEVREVSALFERKLILTREQATETSVKSNGSKYDLMLLSTHGEMIDSNPLRSNLRLTPSERDDGMLTVSEIFDLEIKANLVTLSACETGLARGESEEFPRGDDLIGLSRAFIHAGAPSVVASLWKVSDDSTVQMIRNFYQHMKKMSKAEALQKAQLDLMRSTVRLTLPKGELHPLSQKRSEEFIECSHPFFWAPFILLGDWK